MKKKINYQLIPPEAVLPLLVPVHVVLPEAAVHAGSIAGNLDHIYMLLKNMTLHVMLADGNVALETNFCVCLGIFDIYIFF